MNWFSDAFCNVDERFVALTGANTFALNMVMLVASIAIALYAIVDQMSAFPRLRRRGFSQAVQLLSFFYLFTFPLVQVALAFRPQINAAILHCPAPEIVGSVATIAYFLFVWGIHVERKNKGSARQFLMSIVLPALGVFILTAKVVLGMLLKAFA